MKVSVNWIKEYTNISITNDELIKKIGSQLGEIEEVIELGELYNGIYIVNVVECSPHPQADKLSLCKIDDGGKSTNVQRIENGLIQVVCGAPNVKQGMKAVWLPPGTTIPATVNKEPLILEPKEIRGVISNGMLASPKELGISDDHNGIFEMPETSIPGQLFSEIFGLNDTIIDIENKMLTHRPDLFGQIGIAREIAGINISAFKSPDWYLKTKDLNLTKGSTSLEVKNEIPDLVTRFMAQVITGIQVKPSSPKIQSYLNRVGIRSINNIVDFTNYLMMLSAQPLHAYDLDKLKKLDGGEKASIIVRKPHENEELVLLNTKSIKLNENDIVIASGTKAIGLGGVMGGADVEVDTTTKNIVIECANFDMYSIRRTSMDHGIFSDAVTRFNKGQSPLQNDKILAEIVSEILEDAGGEAEAPIDMQSVLPQPVVVSVKTEFINKRLGLKIDGERMANMLKNVEFEVELYGSELKIRVPFWRTDIHIAEDVVEEIGRLYGYDNLVLELPKRPIKAATKNEIISFKSNIRDILVKAGANEVLTYNFVGDQLFTKVGQDKNLAYQIANPLNPDLQYYRTSLLPSLLEKVHPNIKAGFEEFCLYEINKVHLKNNKDRLEPELPAEPYRLAMVFAVDDKRAKSDYAGAPYYQVRYYLDYLLYALGINYELKPIEQEQITDEAKQLLKPFEPIRTGNVVVGDEIIGYVGEPTSAIRTALKLPKFSAMIELDLITLINHSKEMNYSKISNFPFLEQDVCFKLPVNVTYLELYSLLEVELSKLDQNFHVLLTPLDIFQKDDDKANKQITYRLHISSYEKTLKTSEINELIISLGVVARDRFGAEII